MKALIVTVAVCLFGQLLSARVIYVAFDAAGSGDGSSWSNAYPDLQDAIDGKANDGLDTIFVKAGTYHPLRTHLGSDAPHLFRSRTFTATGVVSVFGGFAGTETSLSERNWTANPTILSGDEGIQGDDTDNVYHVLKLELGRFVEFDGFYVRHGRASGSGTSQNGSGVYVREVDTAILRHLVIEDNQAQGEGGGIYASPALVPSLLTIEQVTVRACSAAHGGGVSINGNNILLSLSRMHVYGNTASGNGGAFYLNNLRAMIATNLLIHQNTTGNEGGGMWARNVRGEWTNLTLSGNQATGGIGGGICGDLNVFVDMYNSILWGNSDLNGGSAATSQIAEDGTEIRIRYSNIEHSNGGGLGWTTDASDYGRNVDLLPEFINPDGPDGLPGTEDDDFSLAVTSPSIDAGTASAPGLPAMDFYGEPRYQGIAVDMGISENPDGIPFPVEFLTFTGQRSAAQSMLSWETMREVNHAYFQVERATTGAPDQWQAVGQVRNQQPTPQGQVYDFVDQLPMEVQSQPDLYYRLRQVDLDGTFSFSSTLVLRAPMVRVEPLLLYPNPAYEMVTLRLPASAAGQPIRVELISADGKRCYVQALDAQSNGVHTLPLMVAEGIYALRIQSETQQWVEKLMVK
jgi:hypothetical protein